MGIRNRMGLAYNLISLVGLILAVTATGLIIVFSAVELISENEHAYVGLLTYFLFPGMLIFGLLLVPLGALQVRNERRKAALEGMVSLEEAIPPFPIINLNEPKKRHVALFFVVATVVFLIVIAVASIQGFEFTESTTFCGELCHPVMTPEFTAWGNSPHARVKCVECHVGPGAAWYVKAKISGLRQLYAVAFHTYPTPIETPIENLRPARETCEHCHWPKKFSLAHEKIFYHYAPDQDNTPRSVDMLIHIGGSPFDATVHGIHWHVASEVTFIARDRSRFDIPYVAVKDQNGKVTEFMDTERPLTADELRNGKRRLMDCTDCHNRPTHIYHSPGQEMDLAFASGRIDRKLPFLKKVAVEALNRPYQSKEEGLATLARAIPAYYASNYPQLAKEKEAAIKAAVEQVKDIYQRNFFPAMKVKWSTYPNNIGHFYTAGCFRCHDDRHKSADGRYISKSCELCHEVLGQVQENIPPGAVVHQFVHPVEIGSALYENNCSDCHLADGHDVAGEGGRFSTPAERGGPEGTVAASLKDRQEAIAMVKRAEAYLKENGKAKTLVEISDPKGEFVKGGLYLFAIDLQGRMLAHGANPRLGGNNMIDFKDPDGKYLFRDFIRVASKWGHGWVSYKWVNPVTGKTEPKSSYVEAAGDIIIGCGIY